VTKLFVRWSARREADAVSGGLRPVAESLLAARLSGHHVMTNGHVCPPLSLLAIFRSAPTALHEGAVSRRMLKAAAVTDGDPTSLALRRLPADYLGPGR